MSRKDPEGAVPQVEPKEKAGYVTQTRAYKVITPLYGGGEETGKADSITVVRGTEVRGHLRFWWRATRGGAFDGDLQKMKQREEEIWGSSGEKGKHGPSRISVRIVDWQKGNLIQKKEISTKQGKQQVEIADPKSPWSYVAFPLRKDEKKPAGSVLMDVFFKLIVTYPNDLTKDIEAALWAWETFGGIGARTRRGFGALQCTEGEHSPLPALQNVKEMIGNGLNEYVASGHWPVGVPHLKRDLRFKITAKKDVALSAWESVFSSLQKFRQQRYESKYGLSQWPEANAIRKLHEKDAKLPKETPNVVVVERFPRAKFGLPIQFNMPHDKELPETLSLQGRRIENGKDKWYDRLASPLILRPIACSDGAVGLAAILEWEPMDSNDSPYTPPGGLVLKGGANDYPVKSDLTSAEASQIPPLHGQTDVLQAFLDFLK